MALKELSGSCACGSISYISTEQPEHLDYCYCLTCQRVSGAPFMAWTGILKSTLQWTFDSTPLVYRATIGDTGICVAERICCGHCGCNISLQYYLYPEKTHVAAGTIRKCDFEMPPVGCHIWARHVPNWHNIPEDGVERYEEFDDVFKARLDKYLGDLEKT